MQHKKWFYRITFFAVDYSFFVPRLVLYFSRWLFPKGKAYGQEIINAKFQETKQRV